MHKTYYTTSGFEIWVGKNHTENEVLTFEKSKWNDLWFHAKGIGGAHVLLKYNHEREFQENDIIETARIAAEHSSNKNVKVVTYTECINIEKPKRSRKGTVVLTGNVREVHL